MTVIEERRSIRCTTFISTPAASAGVAAPWRISCNRIGGNPASRHNS
ncbi:hypothetical protein RPX00_00755 [Amycolatopsis sp. WGS_07]